jgi:hypothetical protein
MPNQIFINMHNQMINAVDFSEDFPLISIQSTMGRKNMANLIIILKKT